MIPYYENRTVNFQGVDRTYGRSHLACAAHLHHHIELVLLLEGQTVAVSGAERCQLCAGDVFIAFPNQIHRYESVGRECYFLFIVNPDLVPALRDTFFDFLPRSARIPGAAFDPEILDLARRLTAPAGEETHYTELTRAGYLRARFSLLLSHTELIKTVPGDSHALKEVLSYCIRNYQKDLSLSLLEEELHISKYYISHLFSDKLHISFNHYINSLRISYACHALRHTDASVTEISEQVGFGTSRTFNRAFLKQVGCTPRAYRLAEKEKKDPAAPEKRGTT